METRTIQSLIFQVADSRNALVAATTDRSEWLLGRYTEAFYGHCAPLAGLYKSEVIALARCLNVEDSVQDSRPGCENYWYDDEVLGAGYDVVDSLLHLLVDVGKSPDQICAELQIEDLDWIEGFSERVQFQPLRTTTRFCPRSKAGCNES
jgi:NH3-dependent NAD+ synthetase